MPTYRAQTTRTVKLISAAFAVAAAVLVGYLIASADSETDIAFPIPELGNCQNKNDCRDWCEQKENISACVSFAEKHNLISPEEAARARAFAKAGEGPGGCRSKNECESFCENPDNIETCVEFGERHELMPPQELKEAKRVIKALKEGAELPGNCRSKKQCEAYCAEPSHMEECFAFAERAGFIPPEEIEHARKVMPLMMRGETPGKCRGKDECEAYCANESHSEECAEFALKAGFMKPEEVEIFKKTRGKGPGNCRGREQCEAFCNNPANQETCFNFAKEHGLIPPEEIEKMREGMMRMREGLGQMPPEALECLKSTVGTEILEKIKAGTLTPGPQIGEQVRKCFENFAPRGPISPDGRRFIGPPEGGTAPGTPPAFGGPGGCKSPEECEKYCREHPEECRNFMEKRMPIPPGLPGSENFPRPVTEKEVICVQVITPAKDPESGLCVNFPNPCVVPPGWVKVEKCEAATLPPRFIGPPIPAPLEPTNYSKPQSRLNPPTLKSLLYGLVNSLLP